MFWQSLVFGIGLVLVIEGIAPFLRPDFWRRSVIFLASHTDKFLRRTGLVVMLAGLLIIILARHFFFQG